MQLKTEKQAKQKVEDAKVNVEEDRDKWKADWKTEHDHVFRLGNEVRIEIKARDTFKDRWLNVKEQLDQSKQTVEAAKDDNRTVSNEKRLLANEVESLRDEKDSLQHVVEAREQSIDRLQTDIAQWKAEAERAIKKEEQGKKEQARLQGRIAGLETEIRDQRKSTVWCRFFSNTFRSLWRTTVDQLRKTQQKCTNLSASNQTLCNEKASLTTELEQCKTNVSELDTQNKKLQEALSLVRAAQLAQAQAQRSCDEALGLANRTPTVLTASSSDQLLQAVDTAQDAADIATQESIVNTVAFSSCAVSMHSALPEADTPDMPSHDDGTVVSAGPSNARARSVTALVQQDRNLVVRFDAQKSHLLRGLQTPPPSDGRTASSSCATRRSTASVLNYGETGGSEDSNIEHVGDQELQEVSGHSQYAASDRVSSETPLRERLEGYYTETKLVRCEECRIRHRRCAHKKSVKVKMGRCSDCRISGSKTACTHVGLGPGPWHTTSTSEGIEVPRSSSRNSVTDDASEPGPEGTNSDLGEEIQCSRPQRDIFEVTDNDINEIAAAALGTPELPLLRSAHNVACSSSSSQTPSRSQHRKDVSASPQIRGYKATERRDSHWPWPGLPDESIDRPSKRQRLN